MDLDMDIDPAFRAFVEGLLRKADLAKAEAGSLAGRLKLTSKHEQNGHEKEKLLCSESLSKLHHSAMNTDISEIEPVFRTFVEGLLKRDGIFHGEVTQPPSHPTVESGNKEKIADQDVQEKGNLPCDESSTTSRLSSTEGNKEIKDSSVEKPHRCQYEGCGKRFRTKKYLRTHMGVHSVEKPHRCQYEGCGKRFRTKKYLKTHMAVHSDDRPHICSVCSKTFKDKKTLWYHNETHKNVKEKPHRCQYEGCGKRFLTQIYLKTHMVVHSDERPHICSVCSMTFKYKRGLSRHNQIHKNDNELTVRGAY